MPDTSFDFLSQRPKTLRSSLEVMAMEIFERLRLRAINAERLEKQKEKLYDLLERVRRQYQMGDPREKQMAYQQLFSLEQELRAEDVQCWRDLILVINSMLPLWQEHEQARLRARMLEGLDV